MHARGTPANPSGGAGVTPAPELLLRDRLKLSPLQARIVLVLYRRQGAVNPECFPGSARQHAKVWIHAIRPKLGQGTIMNWRDGTYSLTGYGRDVVKVALNG